METFGQRGSLNFSFDAPLRFTSSSVGWHITSDRLYRSGDAEQTWREILASSFMNPSQSWFFDDRRTVVAGSDAPGVFHVQRTDDGGTSWRKIPRPSGLPAFASPVHGWVLAKEPAHPTARAQAWTLYRTVDGGEHWTVLSRVDQQTATGGLPLDLQDTRLTFTDATTGWASGTLRAGGTSATQAIFATTDAGATWTRQDLPGVPGFDVTKARIEVPRFPSTGREGLLPVSIGQLLPGRMRVDRYIVYRSLDGGRTWTSPIILPETPPTNTATSGGFIDATNWWLASWRDLWLTYDAGQTWTRSQPLVDWGRDGRFGGVTFADSRHAYASLVTGPATAAGARYSYLESVDGGATWKPVELPRSATPGSP